MKPILFTQRVEVVESYGERRDCADQHIADFFRSCGYLPLPVPNRADLAAEMIDTVRPVGIVLTGGNSLVEYGGNAPERDATDEAYIRLAIKHRIPLYGFCRGMQSILHHYGQPLVSVSGHVAVRMLVHGGTSDRYGNFCREVNAYHNQGCMEIAHPDLQVLATSDDGVVKAVVHATLPILATMWHPERETPFSQDDIRMIKALFQ